VVEFRDDFPSSTTSLPQLSGLHHRYVVAAQQIRSRELEITLWRFEGTDDRSPSGSEGDSRLDLRSAAFPLVSGTLIVVEDHAVKSCCCPSKGPPASKTRQRLVLMNHRAANSPKRCHDRSPSLHGCIPSGVEGLR
jgi:hypothetical protein